MTSHLSAISYDAISGEEGLLETEETYESSGNWVYKTTK
jgi:hypothetical protein